MNKSKLIILKEFEMMLLKLNVPCWTAIQTNKSCLDNELTKQIDENIKNANTIDFFFLIRKSEENN